MGTKKTTTTDSVQKIDRDQKAMAGFHTALDQANGLVTNPYGNQFYQQTYTRGMNAANQVNQNQTQNLAASLSRSGIGENSAAGSMMRQMGGYMASHNQAGAFDNASNQAQSMYGMGMNFLQNPLTTGQTGHQNQVETSGGLGSWLPQLIGAGLSGVAAGMTGGASTLAQQGLKAGLSRGLGAAASSFMGSRGGGGGDSGGGGGGGMGNMNVQASPNAFNTALAGNNMWGGAQGGGGYIGPSTGMPRLF